jgi:hypothetical protein
MLVIMLFGNLFRLPSKNAEAQDVQKRDLASHSELVGDVVFYFWEKDINYKCSKPKYSEKCLDLRRKLHKDGIYSVVRIAENKWLRWTWYGGDEECLQNFGWETVSESSLGRPGRSCDEDLGDCEGSKWTELNQGVTECRKLTAATDAYCRKT